MERKTQYEARLVGTCVWRQDTRDGHRYWRHVVTCRDRLPGIRFAGCHWNRVGNQSIKICTGSLCPPKMPSPKSKSDFLMRGSADTQASFADAVNVAAFFLTNSCRLSGLCPVSVSTSSDIRSSAPRGADRPSSRGGSPGEPA